MADFPHLFQPLRVGPRTIRNRVLVTAHVPGLAEAGVPKAAYAAYHRARARGGVGMQITGASPVHPTSGREGSRGIANLDDRVVAGYRQLADAVHEEGGVILAQLAHYGVTGADGDVELPLWGPSDMASEVLRVQSHAMTKAEIREVVDAFAAAAARAREGGLDGVEILAAFGLLIAAFLSPYSNRRTDEYGGSVENRMRFALEIKDAVREAAGPDMIVGMRIPGDEYVEGGLDIAQMKDIAQRLEAAGGVDYLNVIAGTNIDRINRAAHWPPTPAPHGLFVPLAREIRSVVSLPVFTTGRITDPAHADRIIAEGSADMVGMTRAHIADPDLTRKAEAGRAAEIRPCVGANVCIKRAMQGGPIRCLHNPEAAREHEWGPAQPAEAQRRVAVIGAGPGGLEAALVAAERGHQVKVYEAETGLGGQFALRASIPVWREYQGVIDWRRDRLRELQVPVELGRRITAADIPALEADDIVLATGAAPKAPDLPGEGLRVVTPHELIRDGAGEARRAVLWDRAGGIVGDGAMDAALGLGLALTIVTPQFAVAEDASLVHRVPLYERLLSADAVFLPHTDVTGVAPGAVLTRDVYTWREGRVEDVDLLIAWTGRNADDALSEAITAAGARLHMIGDCVAPRTAEYAIAEGAAVGRRI